MIQEEFVGRLSFWPNVSVRGLLQQIVAGAQTIRDDLPAEYPITKQRFDALITDMSEAEQRCSDWYNLGSTRSHDDAKSGFFAWQARQPVTTLAVLGPANRGRATIAWAEAGTAANARYRFVLRTATG